MSSEVRLQPSNGDQLLEESVLAELRSEHDSAEQRLLSVVVEDGVVHLNGFVASYARKWDIERAAGRILGVRDVRDYLEVRPPEHFRRADDEIERAARHLLGWDARVPRGVRVRVTDGVVRLEGTVERLADADAAEDAVRNLIGVRDIVNEVRVAPSFIPEDLAQRIQGAIRRCFGRLGRDVAAEVTDGVATLTGVVFTFAMIGDVERVVACVPGVKRVDNQLLVA